MDTVTAPATRCAEPGPARRLATLVGLEAVAAAVLTAGASRPATVDWRDLRGWIDTQPAPEVAVALLWPLVTALTAYLLVTTLLYVAARAAGGATAVRLLGRVTLPAVRRVADRAVAAGLVTTTVLGTPAVAAPAPPPVVSVTAGGDLLPPGVRVPATAGGTRPGPAEPTATATPTTTPVPVPVPQVAPPAAAGPAPTEPTAGTPGTGTPPAPATGASHDPAAAGEPAGGGDVHVVVRGDHLWALAARRVAAHLGVPEAQLRDGDVAPHWADVVAANRARLRSGDPDLIHPGERLVLPPVARPTTSD